MRFLCVAFASHTACSTVRIILCSETVSPDSRPSCHTVHRTIRWTSGRTGRRSHRETESASRDTSRIAPHADFPRSDSPEDIWRRPVSRLRSGRLREGPAPLSFERFVDPNVLPYSLVFVQLASLTFRRSARGFRVSTDATRRGSVTMNFAPRPGPLLSTRTVPL